MKHFGIFAALITSVLAAHTYAQSATATPPVLTVATKLVDNSPGDGKIVLSSRKGPSFPAKTAINAEPCPVTSVTPAFSYTKFGVACPVPRVPIPDPTPTPEPSPTPTPTPEPTQPGQEVVIKTNTVNGVVWPTMFVRSPDGKIAISLAHDGHLGGNADAPAGWAKTLPTEYNRFALRSVARNIDPMIIGANAGGFVLKGTRGGVRFRLSNLVGRLELPNAAVTPNGLWSAEAKGVRVEQRPVITPTGVRLGFVVANTGIGPIEDLRIVYQIDFTDYEREFKTDNRIASPSLIEAKLLGTTKATAYLEAFDARFVPSIGGFINEDPDAPFLTSQPLGYSLNGNHTVNLTGLLGNLPEGEATRFDIATGVR